MVISNNWGFGLWLWSSINMLRQQCAKQKWQACRGDDSLFPDNSNPMWIRLGHFGPNLYLHSTMVFLSNASSSFLLEKLPFAVSHCRKRDGPQTERQHFHFDVWFKHNILTLLTHSANYFVVSHVGPGQNVITRVPVNLSSCHIQYAYNTGNFSLVMISRPEHLHSSCCSVMYQQSFCQCPPMLNGSPRCWL